MSYEIKDVLNDKAEDYVNVLDCVHRVTFYKKKQFYDCSKQHAAVVASRVILYVLWRQFETFFLLLSKFVQED